MISFGVSVVLNRNPVASALSLVGSFLCLASLFIGLNAYFIATIQVLVYAGAVMVLFLFIIMLLDLKAEERRAANKLAFAGGVFVTVSFSVFMVAAVSSNAGGNAPYDILPERDFSDVHWIGTNLFSHFNLHLQIVGCLLVVATVGVVALSQRAVK
jgi:NADH-quinone oxidoreductase subunit J